ncbi:MAG: hypothetical protein ACI4M9_04525 [Succinivibrio sp.]
MYLKVLAASFLSLLVFSAQTKEQECTLSYRPSPDETAFAAVGSSLKIADKTCIEHVLILPFDTVSGGVTIPKGQYNELLDEDTLVSFSTKNSAGADDVSSCAFCDPIDALVIRKSNLKQLCVRTSLRLISCAKTDEISYTITSRKLTKTGLCTPALVYSGRTGSTLHFAVNDCTNVSKPTLTYDLSLGSSIRFLDDEIEIVKADNHGLYYTIRKARGLKNNDILKSASKTLAEIK